VTVGSGSAVIQMKHGLQFCCYPMQSRSLAFHVDKKKATLETERMCAVISICGSAAQFTEMEFWQPQRNSSIYGDSYAIASILDYCPIRSVWYRWSLHVYNLKCH
jgi:hypothetical protein